MRRLRAIAGRGGGDARDHAERGKALLHRARVALRKARHHVDLDVPVDDTVVDRFAAAIRAGSIETLTELLAEDVWGVVDGGGVIQTSTKPSFGRRAVSRQWANARRRLGGLAVAAEVRPLNGEAAILVHLEDQIFAVVHLETRAGRVAALFVNRDPKRIARLSLGRTS